MLSSCASAEIASPSQEGLRDGSGTLPRIGRRLRTHTESARRPMTFPIPPLLTSLGEEALALVKNNLRRMTVPANVVLYYQEDVGHAVYFVEVGHVRLSHIGEDGSIAFYGIVPSGRSFGEISAFDRSGYCDTATTIDETTLCTLDTVALQGDTPAHLELRQRISDLLALRLRAHVRMTRALYMPNLSGRLAHSLLYLLDTMGTRVTVQGQEVECLGPEVTQRDLGTLARGTRENVNKMLRTWIRDDVLAIEDRHIIVRSRVPLESKAFGV